MQHCHAGKIGSTDFNWVGHVRLEIFIRATEKDFPSTLLYNLELGLVVYVKQTQ